MPARRNAPPGAPVWIDLMTSDPDRSREFYTELFGWAAEDPAEEFGGYFNFLHKGERVAGCMRNQPEFGSPDVWSVYLASDDAQRTAKDATAAGGQVYVEPAAVADLGHFAVVGDTGGASIGVWQPGTHPGFQAVEEPGAPGWFELHTRDYDKVVDFYRAAFRWEIQELDDPNMRYAVLRSGDQWLAGIMDASGFLPEGVPAHWSVYFAVADTDAALAKVGELGGSVAQPAEDTPYGRLATVTDATGTQLKLVGPNAAMPADS
jgi:predicted enzyme related to lactoylglutathione lyase